MRLRWYILAALAATLATFVVWAWPHGPMWWSKPGAGRLTSLSPDGRIVITTIVPQMTAQGNPDPIICRWNAETGELLSKVTFPCKDPMAWKAVTCSYDGTTALVGEGPFRVTARYGFEAGDWYIHDGLTGERRFGPIKGVEMVAHRAFSPDGRWFSAERGIGGDSSNSSTKRQIFAAATGEEAVTLSDEPDMISGQCRFAPDSSSVAVSWWDRKIRWPDRRMMIQIIDLPSGRERLRVELPKRPWIRIEKWDGRRFFVVQRLPPDETNTEEEHCWEFDTTHLPIGEGSLDPLLVGHVGWAGTPNSHWVTGCDWAAFFSILPNNPPPKSKLEEWRDWFATRLGFEFPSSKRMHLSGRFVDRTTGATRFELPRPVCHGVFISDDGRRMVCPRGEDAIEVWDVNPPSRWPRALAAGAVVAAGILGIGRWRRRREMARTSPLPACPTP